MRKKLHERAHAYLLRRVALRRAPDVEIGGSERPYLRRWFIIPRNRFLNIYLHQFCRPDDDRALHDHPWINASWILAGSYIEHTIEAGGVQHRVKRTAGSFCCRRAVSAHRVELIERQMPVTSNCTVTGWSPAGYEPCWSLFVTGPRIREWGFHCPGGWKHWKDFTAFNSGGSGNVVGPGCGEGE